MDNTLISFFLYRLINESFREASDIKRKKIERRTWTYTIDAVMKNGVLPADVATGAASTAAAAAAIKAVRSIREGGRVTLGAFPRRANLLELVRIYVCARGPRRPVDVKRRSETEKRREKRKMTRRVI